MLWLVPIVVHALVWLVVLIDVSARSMTPQERTVWLTAVALVPVAGVAFYAWRGRGDESGDDIEGGGGD